MKRETDENGASAAAPTSGACSVTLAKIDADLLHLRDNGRMIWYPQFATRNTRLEVNFGQQVRLEFGFPFNYGLR